ncbi:MAG: hypothetical protein KC502_14020 [Myxococcales bacterium]|nr:hypothetical protein [Myxococcales bacterium]
MTHPCFSLPKAMWRSSMWLVVGLLLVVAQACGPTQTCTPGETQSCVCSDGAKGAQVCAGSGERFGACVCTGELDQGDITSSKDAGNSDTGAAPDTQGSTDPACDCAKVGAQCGFLPNCSKPCGACPAGKLCQSNKCVQQQVEKKVPFGGACGPSKECVYPPSSAKQSVFDAYFDCINDMCEDGRCRNGVCIKSCTISKDAVHNFSGKPGADGVEDPTKSSECDDAIDGPYGDKFRCVEFRDPSDVQNGQSNAFCYPGHSWKPCKGSGDCVGNNSCQIRYVFGQYGTFCVPKHKTPAGKKHVELGGSCNTNKYNGDVKICASNWCSSSWGCRAFCGDDSDCVSDVGACQAGKCTNGSGGTAKACKSDSDCSAMFCKSGLKYYSNLDQTFSMCFAKNCELTSDCAKGYGCKLNWNGVVSPDGDPDPQDNKKLIYPGWNHICLPHKEGGVKAGEICDLYPSDSNTDDPACNNSSFCRDGFCGNLCKGDSDCAANMKCGAREFGFDSDDDGWYDYRIVAEHCIGLPGATTACVANDSCGAGKVCKPWVHKTGKTIPGKGGAPAKDEYTSSGMCITKVPKRAQFAEYCGIGKDGVQCQTNICLQVFSNQNYGICTDACDGRSDCPAKVKIGSYTYKSVCSSRYVMSNQTLLDPTDDVFTPVCWPSSDSNSLEDCSKTRTCALKGEACFPRVIARGPDTAAKVEYWCMRVNGSSEPAPTKKPGESCDPDANVNPCLGGYCLDDAGKGTGYCSALCLKNSDCGAATDGMICNVDRQQIPRKDKTKAAIVPLCMKAKACIPCSDNYDCTGTRLCTNVGGTGELVERRCAPQCTTDKDCKAGNGVGSKCTDRRDRFGKKTGEKVCALSCS